MRCSLQQRNPTPTSLPDWPDEFIEKYIAAGYWRDETFDRAFAEVARRYPLRTALTHESRSTTYGELQSRIQRLAAGLGHAGLTQGDHVVVHLPNGIEFVETCFALFQLGVRPVLALPAHRQHEITGFCRVASAKAYIGADHPDGFDPRPLASSLLSNGYCEVALIHGVCEAPLVSTTALYESSPLAHHLSSANDVACFQLSGGTTGTPKLIPRRHREYLYNVRACIDVSGFDEHTVYLAALPMAHNFMLCCPGVMGTLLAGGRVISSSQSNAAHCFSMIEREHVTHTALVPPLVMLWLDAQAERCADLSSLRLLQVGGSRLSSNAAQRVAPILGCNLQQVLGMAEGLICLTRLTDPPERVLHTQGRPLSAADEIRILDSDGNQVERGAVGELQVRGPYTIRGYYGLEQHNATAFTTDGFYRTGDQVSMTADGYLIVEGRDKDQINRGGEKVVAEEIENLLIAHPQVHDAAVVAMTDRLLGERVCAFVVPRQPPPSSLRLKQYLHSLGLASFKVPDSIKFVEAFPSTGIGKTSKKDLREYLRRNLELPQ